MTFIVQCRNAALDEKAFEVDGIIISVALAKILVSLYDGMRIKDREEFFKQPPREILAAIQLSLSGSA